jgi:two-component system cell cycle sensor histidine kinase/response regulator CckA
MENEISEADQTGKQILIAEDEPMIRSLLQRLLNLWGYRTLVAEDGKRALEVADQHPGEIDLLLSDVTMPGMGGPELAEKLTKKRPRLKVILMSGFSQAQIILQRGWQFLQKPFTPRDIKKKIDEVL